MLEQIQRFGPLVALQYRHVQPIDSDPNAPLPAWWSMWLLLSALIAVNVGVWWWWNRQSAINVVSSDVQCCDAWGVGYSHVREALLRDADVVVTAQRKAGASAVVLAVVFGVVGVVFVAFACSIAFF